MPKNTPARKSKSKSEQPDEEYLARIDDGEVCQYQLVDGELVEVPIDPDSRPEV